MTIACVCLFEIKHPVYYWTLLFRHISCIICFLEIFMCRQTSKIIIQCCQKFILNIIFKKCKKSSFLMEHSYFNTSVSFSNAKFFNFEIHITKNFLFAMQVAYFLVLTSKCRLFLLLINTGSVIKRTY